MTQPPTPQTVAQAAREWLANEQGCKCSDLAYGNYSERREALQTAFAAGVKWLTDELNEAMRKRGTLQ